MSPLKQITLIALTVVAPYLFAAPARADIYRWDNGQVIPGTEGIEPGPGLILAGAYNDPRNLRYANFSETDLSRSNFQWCWLDNANLTRANLTSAYLPDSILTGANLSGANLANASFTADNGDSKETGSDLTSANLTEANLTNARLEASKLTNADLTGAVMTGANFIRSEGISKEQLYSTASYEQKNLQGIAISNDLSGWDFSGQDTRGARLNLTGAITRNAILPEGYVEGLDLAAGEQLVVRNSYQDPDNGLAPIPISVQDHMTMGDGGVLQLLFDVDPWDSLISFEPGIPVTLGGTLELNFADDVDVTAQIGRTIRVFDWTGVEPTGAFTVDSDYLWDLSNLYTSGEVTLVSALPGDTNGDGQVGLDDLNNVRNHFGGAGLGVPGDTNADQVVDLIDLNNVRNFFGVTAPQAVPEPTGLAIAIVLLAAITCLRTTHVREWALTSIVALAVCASARADTFGTGDNQFTIDFVTVGNPGNPADTTGTPNPAGSVPYVYRMGKYEISRDMVTQANVVGNLGITLEDLVALGIPSGNGPNKPSTGVSWNEATRFVNWLNTSQGFPAAYKFNLQPGEVGYDANVNIELWQPNDPGYDAHNLFRNSLAHYFLPSADEWYKAAFYDPNANGGVGGYWDFPTGSDSIPTPVASGADQGTAVWSQPAAPGPADITQAGGLSPYGTMAQGGNVWEWSETEEDLVNDDADGALRGLRGAGWVRREDGNWNELSAIGSKALFGDPMTGDGSTGFRVASVPEPSTLLPGDTNGDQTVDLNDLNNVRNHFGETGAPGLPGDAIPFDGVVDLGDLNAVRNNFGASTPQPVPEPASLLLMAVGAVGLAALRPAAPQPA